MINCLVKNWMTSPAVTVTPNTTIVAARDVMSEQKIKILLIAEKDQLLGVVTQRGLIRIDFSVLGEEGCNESADFSEIKIESIMTRNPRITQPDSSISKAARVMLENRIAALPVVEDERLIGILSSSDLMRFIIYACPLLEKEILVDQYMSDEIISVNPKTTLLEAHRLTGTKRIRTLPVLDDDRLVGIVTRTDLVCSDPSRLASKEHQDLLLKFLVRPVEKVMKKNLITISPDAPIAEAAQLMLENGIHSLLVVDDAHKLTGVLTESDLFLMIVQKFF